MLKLNLYKLLKNIATPNLKYHVFKTIYETIVILAAFVMFFLTLHLEALVIA